MPCANTITKTNEQLASEEVASAFAMIDSSTKCRVMVIALLMDDEGQVYRCYRSNPPKNNDHRLQMNLGLASVMRDVLVTP